MPENDKPAEHDSARGTLAAKINDFIGAFVDLLRVPRAFWFINVAFMIDSMAYFGVLTLMTAYLSGDIGLHDTWASIMVSIFTGCVTLFMIGFGGLAERLGIRKGLILALLVCFAGRAFYSAAAHGPLVGAPMLAVITGLLFIALGEGIVQPISYAGIKQYTDEKTNSMGYGLIYALMNLGIVLIGLVSPLVRVPVDDLIAASSSQGDASTDAMAWVAERVPSGIAAVNWLCLVVTGVAFIFYIFVMTRKVEANRLRGEDEEAKRERQEAASRLPWTKRVMDYFAEGPFTNARFIFFIFMLLPVQTLFAHQWLTMPLYVLRAYPEGVADRMEWIVNWINPGIIFFGVPVATALTRRANMYTMMIVGSTVSALPTFLLCGGPDLSLLITYIVLFSIGEALWQPRFLQYAAELAPEGKVAQYMGLANVPWITAKMTTGLYSGRILSQYCPEQGPQDTPTMWLIYGFIAVVSPIGLILGRRWVMQGLHQPATSGTGAT